MRTQRQQAIGGAPQPQGNMVDEFFGQERQTSRAGPMMGSPFEFSDLKRELDSVRQQRGNWANEFQQDGPKLWELTPGEEQAMERAFLESKAAAGPSQNASGKEVTLGGGRRVMDRINLCLSPNQSGEMNS